MAGFDAWAQPVLRRLAGRKDHFMHRDLLANQFETLEESGEALVTDIDDSPNGIVPHIRSDPRSVKVE